MPIIKSLDILQPHDVKLVSSQTVTSRNNCPTKATEVVMFDFEMKAERAAVIESGIFVIGQQKKNGIKFSFCGNIKTNIDEQEYNIAMATLIPEVKRLSDLSVDQEELMTEENTARMEAFFNKVLGVYSPLIKIRCVDDRYAFVLFAINRLIILIECSDFATDSPKVLVDDFIDSLQFFFGLI